MNVFYHPLKLPYRSHIPAALSPTIYKPEKEASWVTAAAPQVKCSGEQLLVLFWEAEGDPSPLLF